MPIGSLRRALVPPRGAWLAAVVVALLLGSFATPGAQAVPLAAPTGLSPSSVPVTGTPVLEWDRVTGATSYTVEVASTDSFDTLLWSISTTNRKAVPNRQLGDGTIHWRVRALAGSTAGEWSSAEFDRDPLAGPSLISPAPGTVLHQPDEPALVSWTPVDGAVSYVVQVGTDEAFTDPLQYDEYSVKTPSFVVPDPQVAQPYFWRVQAVLANGILTQWSDSRDYQIGGLSKPVLVSPEDGPFTDVTDVVLDWEPVPGAKTYNVQVSTDENFSDSNLDVNATGVVGTRYSPPVTVANDQYYWRVQPVDAQGNKLDWGAVDTWTFRRYWPDQPALEYPADGDTVADPFFYQWTPVRLATSYTLEVSPSPDFGVLLGSCSTVHTTFVPSSRSDCFPSAAGTFYWRVVATDAPGVTRDRDAIRTDVINAEVRQFTYDPVMPSQVAPGDGEMVTVPTLSWTSVPGAEAYKVTITALAGGTGGGTFTTYATSYTPRMALTSGKSYRWQVQAVSGSGRIGTATLTGSQPTFTVDAAAPPADSTPEPLGSPDPSFRFPTLSWTPVVDATSYRVLVRPMGNLAWSTLADKFPYPAGEDDTDAWLTAGDYEWRVEAYDGTALLSSSGGSSTFTILPLDDVTGQRVAMSGTATSDGSVSCDIALPERCTDLRHTPVLAWDPLAEAGSYKVFIARDEEMTNLLSGYPKKTESTMFLPTAALPDSQAGSAYYWVVRPCRATTRCAATTHATNAFNKLSKPIELLGPEPDETRANEITFTWRDYLETNQDPDAYPVSDPSGVHDVAPTVEAKQYRVQVSADPNFQTYLEQAVVDQTTFTSATNTYPEGPLYWRVQAIDAGGNSLTWSAGSRFVKASPTVTPLEPLSDAEVSGTQPFRWEPLTYAASYDIEIFKNADTTGSTTNRVRSGNSKQVAFSPGDPLPVSSQPYTWRVRPVDAKGRPGRWTDLDDPAARFLVVGVAPTLLEPAPDVYVHANDGLFTWAPVSGATSYKFERRLVGATGSAETVTTPALAWAPKSVMADGSWQWRVSSLDAAGKVLGSSEWEAFRVDGTPPALSSYGPRGKVSRSASFVVEFDEPVSSVNAKSFKLFAAGGSSTMLATVTLNATGTKAKLDPTATLVSGRKYTLKLTSGIRDPAGNRLAATSWQVSAK